MSVSIENLSSNILQQFFDYVSFLNSYIQRLNNNFQVHWLFSKSALRCLFLFSKINESKKSITPEYECLKHILLT